MPQPWTVSGENVWKRYCRSLRKSVRYALSDSLRAFVGITPGTVELRDDEFWSLRNVSFQLAPGEGMALVGNNGAGKSTLLKILSGVIAPDRGELRVRGRMVSLMLAGAGFHPMLTGRENIYIFGAILGMRRREIERRMPAILDFAELTEFLDTPVKYYSTGMYMRLAFGVAAHSDPSVLIVDEVLAVGDIAFREKCIERLVDMKRRGCTLLLVSHSSGYLRRLADQGLWLQRGECVAFGPVEEVLDRYLAEIESAPSGPAASTPPAGPAAPPPPVALATHGAPTIELLHAGDATTVSLLAHQDNRLMFRLRFPGPGPEPTATLAIVTKDGTSVAGASIVLGAATYPQPRPGADFIVTFDARPHLGALDGTLSFTVSGGAWPAVTSQWPCRVAGVEGRRDHLDLQEQITAAPCQDTGDWSRGVVVDPGEQVAIAASVADQPTAWLLLDDRQELVARVPLPPVVAPLVAVSGGFRANLAPGCYRQALEVATGRILGPELQVAAFTDPVGHVDLEGRCHITGVSTDEHGAGDGMRLGEFVLEGGTQALDELLRRTTRVATDLRNSGTGLTALVTGEACRARVRVHSRATLRDWDVSVGFRHPERGRCGAMRLRRDTIRMDSGACEICFEFKAHLAPGEYLLSCTVSARDERGETVEAHALDFAKCFVLGPGESGSDGSVDFHDLQEAAVPAPAGDVADLEGIDLRLLGFSLNEKTHDERATMPAGQAAIVHVDVLAASEVSSPSFKFSFVNHGKRVVSRVTGLELRHQFQPLARGATRRYVMRFTPHLAGGLYQVQIALLGRSGHQWKVMDRRVQAAMCQVPARSTPIGPGWLEARVLVDVE